MATTQNAAVYSCNCLNVRCYAQSASGPPPETQLQDPLFFPVYVGDEGTTIAHNQVTLRKRTKITKDEDNNRWFRYMSLTCLLCETLAYRVLQIVPPEAEGSEGPVLPSQGWAEGAPLKSVNGWVEVHKGCLTGEAVRQLETSLSYSPIFRVVLPAEMPSSPIDPLLKSGTPPEPSTLVSRTSLPPIPPIFPPAPFTPSHPTFNHLASLATEESARIRSQAEEYLAAITQEKVNEINHIEEELRRQVELLWRKFRKEILRVEEQSDDISHRPLNRRRDSGTHTRSSSAGKVNNGAAPVSIRSFIPDRSSTSRAPSPSGSRAQSALSVSLATSSFQHPRAQEAQIQPQTSAHASRSVVRHDSLSSGDSLADDAARGRKISARSQSIPSRVKDDPSINILSPFHRNMDQSKDIATSFKYFAVLHQHLGIAAPAETEATAHDTPQSPPKALPVDGNNVNKGEGPSTPTKRRKSRSKSRTREEEESPKKDSDLKARRKVTFNVQPAVVTITRDVTPEGKRREAPRGQERSEDMIFALDDDVNGQVSSRGVNGTATEGAHTPSLPLNELVRAPPRPRGRRRKASNEGLPQSYSSLRPASLPAPSNVRPMPDDELPDSPRSLKADAQLGEQAQRKMKHNSRGEDDDRPLDPREEEILKLVAADTPSHRGAWNKDSKAWQTFVRRQDRRSRVSMASSITEENEEESEYDEGADAGIFDDFEDPSESELEEDYSDDTRSTGLMPQRLGSSMPIAIGPLSGPKKALGIPSYQPKTSLSDRPGIMVPVFRPAQRRGSDSATLRKASYAERDRMRERDPGALDFTEEAVLEEEEEEETDSENVPEPGSVGRQHALKILKARSKVPSAGMWRSLAE